MPKEIIMTLLYVLGGIIALGLMIYLVIALLKPELFS
jgi:K+-transporting ATPase KdpF subunit